MEHRRVGTFRQCALGTLRKVGCDQLTDRNCPDVDRILDLCEQKKGAVDDLGLWAHIAACPYCGETYVTALRSWNSLGELPDTRSAGTILVQWRNRIVTWTRPGLILVSAGIGIVLIVLFVRLRIQQDDIQA